MGQWAMTSYDRYQSPQIIVKHTKKYNQQNQRKSKLDMQGQVVISTMQKNEHKKQKVHLKWPILHKHAMLFKVNKRLENLPSKYMNTPSFRCQSFLQLSKSGFPFFTTAITMYPTHANGNNVQVLCPGIIHTVESDCHWQTQ